MMQLSKEEFQYLDEPDPVQYFQTCLHHSTVRIPDSDWTEDVRLAVAMQRRSYERARS